LCCGRLQVGKDHCDAQYLKLIINDIGGREGGWKEGRKEGRKERRVKNEVKKGLEGTIFLFELN
jgi:hypothetical protein